MSAYATSISTHAYTGRRSYPTVKRTKDIILALVALPLILPVIGVLYALTIRDGGPGFFGHTRIGKNGKPFRCWKIRTMVSDADRALREHLQDNPEAAEEWHRDFKLTDDPRITPLGGFLRRSSLDELPQIWNVLRGEMSFVGPRPVTREELSRYRSHKGAYLSLRPGITGPWQVSGRNDLNYDERVELDSQYAANNNFTGDLAIIYRTGSAVLNRTGK